MREKLSSFFLKYQEVFFWLLIGISLDIAFLMLKDVSLIADEGFHVPQISRFLAGDFRIFPDITVLPVYHGIMAGILKLIGADSIDKARLVTFLGSAIGIWVFYLIVRRLWPEERFLRTLQFVFLPILFPLHFLVYTDTWALALVLFSLERALAARPWQSAVAITVAILMRQPNLVWAVMIWMLLVWKPDSLRDTFEAISSQWHRTTLPFAMIFVGFVVFSLINHGVAVGDKSQHEISFNLANDWFFGLCFFIFFLPTCIGTLFRLWSHLRESPKWTGVGLSGAFLAFMATYHATHQYNQASLWFYLRNRVLYWTARITPFKILTFLPVLLGLQGFIMAPMGQRRFRVLMPVTLASIVVMPLIDQRYYLGPFSIFLAFRRLEAPTYERLNTAFYMGVSFLFQWGISRHLFFL